MVSEGVWIAGLEKLFTVEILSSVMDVFRRGEVLPFNPTKAVCLVGWFYLCLYSVKRSEDSRLVADKYRFLSNLSALVIGPLW